MAGDQVPALLRRPWPQTDVAHSLADALSAPDPVIGWLNGLDSREAEALPPQVLAAVSGYIGAVSRLTLVTLAALNEAERRERAVG